jgi:hypothetical protein
MAWPFSTPSSVDLSLAASAWQNYQDSIDRISIKGLKLVKENHRYSQAAAASPPQEQFSLPTHSPVS